VQTPPTYVILFLIAAIAAIVATISILLILILINQRRQRHFEKSMEELKLDHEKNILKTQTEIHEQTLKNISREIHDNIHLSLIMAKMSLFGLALEDRKDIATRSDQSIALISNAITDLSAMSRSLNSDLITSQGLIKALQQELERIKRCTRLAVELQITGEPVYLECEKELFIFRIVQEAFNNVLKHARANNVWLNIHYENNLLGIRIKDNGQGFVEEAPGKKGAATSGLANIRYRTHLFNGSVSIKSEVEKGTELFVTIPF